MDWRNYHLLLVYWTAWAICRLASSEVWYVSELFPHHACFENRAYRPSSGPIVRVSPTEIHVNDIPTVKQIHKVGSPYMKSEWYLDLTSRAVETVFNTTNPVFHSHLRKLLSGPIADANLKQYESIVTSRVTLAVDRIGEEIAARGAADVFKWATFLATDIIGELSFGESFQMLEHREVRLLSLVRCSRHLFLHLPWDLSSLLTIDDDRKTNMLRTSKH